MKKFTRILVLVSILVISLCGCTNQKIELENNDENIVNNQKSIVESNGIEMNEKSGDKYSTKIENTNSGTRYSTVKSDFKADIVIGDNYYATQIADISVNFDSYEGKLVEIEGFSIKNNYYGFTFVGRYSENDICPDCPTGYAYFEYEWHGDEPLDLGTEKTWIKVKGKLKTGNDGVEYRYIDAYSIEVMDEWGVATVKN